MSHSKDFIGTVAHMVTICLRQRQASGSNTQNLSRIPYREKKTLFEKESGVIRPPRPSLAFMTSSISILISNSNINSNSKSIQGLTIC